MGKYKIGTIFENSGNWQRRRIKEFLKDDYVVYETSLKEDDIWSDYDIYLPYACCKLNTLIKWGKIINNN